MPVTANVVLNAVAPEAANVVNAPVDALDAPTVAPLIVPEVIVAVAVVRVGMVNSDPSKE